MLLLILYLMLQNNIFTDALPLIALYAFVGYRLTPAQRILHWPQLRFRSFINSIYDDFKSLDKKQQKIMKVLFY